MEKMTITVKEMATQLGVSIPLAYQLANRSDFPVIQIGRRKIIPVDGFRRWLEKASGLGISS